MAGPDQPLASTGLLTGDRLGQRRPHALLDLPSRLKKGLKIERILGIEGKGVLKILEIGTGSGGIAHYFGTHSTLSCEVQAVDVRDNRLVTDGYTYQTVADTTLPFENESFDVVLTNHVIEHVGDAAAQRHHLREIRRVMRRDGVGYLAVPNRWMVIEPHYGVAFLSWLPSSLRSNYLMRRRGVSFYDCAPLTMRKLEQLIGDAGLAFENKGLEALRLTLELEHAPHSKIRIFFRHIPDRLIIALGAINPTLVYKIARSELPTQHKDDH